jgi:hypothetical protein
MHKYFKKGKEFIIDSKKATENRTLLLYHVLTIGYLYKREVDRIFNKILFDEKIQFKFPFESMSGGKTDGEYFNPIGIEL